MFNAHLIIFIENAQYIKLNLIIVIIIIIIIIIKAWRVKLGCLMS